eukprot:scaffold19097_cov95-Isochrysis_galbana.AAC.1
MRAGGVAALRDRRPQRSAARSTAAGPAGSAAPKGPRPPPPEGSGTTRRPESGHAGPTTAKCPGRFRR